MATQKTRSITVTGTKDKTSVGMLAFVNKIADNNDAIVYIIGSSRGSYQMANDIFQFNEGQ